jgi:hypothetical protein
MIKSKALLALLLIISLFQFTNSVDASDEKGGHYSLVSGVYTHHWTESEEHSKVWLIGLEQVRADKTLSGLAYFKNSFNQPSLFFYPWGRVYRDVLSVPSLRLKWGAGVLYGYVGEYKEKVPFNYKGFSPGLIAAAVWKLDKQKEFQVNLLGTAGLMFSINYAL